MCMHKILLGMNIKRLVGTNLKRSIIVKVYLKLLIKTLIKRNCLLFLQKLTKSNINYQMKITNHILN